MKFHKILSANITPEWRSQYIEYEVMRKMITDHVENLPESINMDTINLYHSTFAEEFFQICEEQLEKINLFFNRELNKAKRTSEQLREDLQKLMEQRRNQTSHSRSNFSFARVSRFDFTSLLNKKTARDLMSAYSELYLSLILLHNYQTLNYTGFRKILKRYDKHLEVQTGKEWFDRNVETAPFRSNEVKDLMRSVERMVTNNLEHGDRRRAMERLRVPPINTISYPWTSYRVGFYLGTLITLVALVIISFSMRLIDAEVSTCILLFHAPFTIILFLMLLGVNLFYWRRFGINHVLIFELNPRDYLTPVHFQEIAAVFGCILSLCVLGFLHGNYLYMPPYLFPLLLPVIMIIYLINPVRIFHYRTRIWLIRVLIRIACAPFYCVIFPDFWLADQFNSLVSVFVSTKRVICYYGTPFNWHHAKGETSCDSDYLYNSVVQCLPAWFRFAQCCRRYRDTKDVFPHLYNAGKYATTFFVVFFNFLKDSNSDRYTDTFNNPFTWMWFVAGLVSSSYGYAWDIKMDWGLLDKKCNGNTFLRSHIVYPSCFYYFAIIENFLLRYLWTASFFLKEKQIVSSNSWTPISEALEVVRRFIWNFIRLENEHLNNCGRFRAVRDISVKLIEMDNNAAPAVREPSLESSESVNSVVTKSVIKFEDYV